MKDLTEVVRIMENAVLAISGSAQIDPAADWGSLKPVLPRLVKESIDFKTWQALSTCAGGEVIPDF